MKRRSIWFNALLTILCLSMLVGCGATPVPPTATPVPPTVAPTGTPTPPTATPVPPTATPAPTATETPAPVPVLTLVDPEGKEIPLTMEELKALPATEGWAGIKSSTGKITLPEQFKGVSLADLAEQLGGMTEELGISLVANDGYAMTYSIDQATKGDFIAYDPGTGDERTMDEPLTAIVAYERAGEPLNEKEEGTLRLVVVSSKNNQVTDGHWSVKWVSRFELKSLGAEWTLQLDGALKEEMDRGTFESCSSPTCHGVSWKDDKAQLWDGTPLWLLLGRIDDEVKHETGAYNADLADAGYSIDVVAVDGYTVTFDSATVKKNNDILLAYQVNENPLEEKFFPLRLVGAALSKKEMAGQVAKIVIKPAEGGVAAATATPSAVTAPATGSAALTISGAVSTELALSMDDLKGMEVVQVTAEHPKKGQQTNDGVRLNALLDKAGVKADAKTLVITAVDGFTGEVALADVGACGDCLIAFTESGTLKTVMPGMQSNLWIKDVVKLEVK